MISIIKCGLKLLTHSQTSTVTVEVWKWISNIISHLSGHAITYSCHLYAQLWPSWFLYMFAYGSYNRACVSLYSWQSSRYSCQVGRLVRFLFGTRLLFGTSHNNWMKIILAKVTRDIFMTWSQLSKKQATFRCHEMWLLHINVSVE